jgi:hypothetical protein
MDEPESHIEDLGQTRSIHRIELGYDPEILRAPLDEALAIRYLASRVLLAVERSSVPEPWRTSVVDHLSGWTDWIEREADDA